MTATLKLGQVTLVFVGYDECGGAMWLSNAWEVMIAGRPVCRTTGLPLFEWTEKSCVA